MPVVDGTLRIDTAPVFKPLLGDARYKGAHGGRGSGKSHFFAELLVERALLKRGTRAVCIRETQKSLDQSAKRLVEDKILEHGLDKYFQVQQNQIKTPGDGLIIFQGMQNHTADSIKSLEGYEIAWVEEAQTLSQRSLDLLRPTIREANSELWFSWNPEAPTDPIETFLRCDNPPPDSVVVEANYLNNPWFPDVLRDEMVYDQGRDIDKYNHVWLGQYQQHSESRVFKNWKVEEFEPDPDAVMRQGADWGFSVDPTVLVQCYIEGRKLYVTHEAYRVHCEIVDIPDLFLSVPDAEKWPIVADSARPETISHVKRHGFPKIQAAVKGARSLEEGVEFLQSFDIVVHPRCTHTIDELSSYRYKTDQLTGTVLSVLEDKNNHVIDALRYACEGARRIRKNTFRPTVINGYKPFAA